MQKIIEIKFSGQESSFKTTRIMRSRLYGSKRRISIDTHGHECLTASLTEDGRFILPNGGTTLLYLDKQGDVAERNQLRGINANGKVSSPEESAPNAVLEAGQAVEAADILECSITHAYALEPVFISATLEDSLSQGAIYRLPECNGRQAFLLGNDAGYFLLFGERTEFDFIGLAEADVSLPKLDFEDTDDDLDFAML